MIIQVFTLIIISGLILSQTPTQPIVTENGPVIGISTSVSDQTIMRQRRINRVVSEDCLYLDIITPTLNTSAKLPVMLWIHGGGFAYGSGEIDGSQLDLRNVVVVTINYRLGVFGFLFGNSSEAPGNVGLCDQVMALNWTARNIANFGGNPSDITLFGQSAGSICISDLIVSNASIGAIN